MSANITLRFVLLYGVSPTALRTAVEQVSVALADRALTALPVQRYHLDDIVAAHEAVEAGTNRKVMLDIA